MHAMSALTHCGLASINSGGALMVDGLYSQNYLLTGELQARAKLMHIKGIAITVIVF